MNGTSSDYYDAPPAEGAPEKPKQEIGTWARLCGVVTSPRKTFQDVARVSGWLMAWVVVASFSLPPSVFMSFSPTAEQSFLNQIEESGVYEKTPSDQHAMLDKVYKIIWKAKSLLAALIGWPLLWLIIAGLCYVPLKIIGGQQSFSQMLSVTIYSSVIPAIKSWLSIPIVLLQSDPAQLDVNNVVRSNLTPFLPEGASKALYALAASVDIFSFWWLAVIAVGYGVVSKRPVGSAVTVGIWWFVLTAVSVVVTALFVH